MGVEPADLWRFLLPGYLLTIALETPVLLIGLSPRHSLAQRFFAGLWLTACTYPIVVLVLPILLIDSFGYWTYLAVAEVFAPAAECLLFWSAFGGPSFAKDARATDVYRDCAAVVVANLVSFLLGGWLLLRFA